VVEAFLRRETAFLSIREQFQGEGEVAPLQQLMRSVESLREKPQANVIANAR